MNVAAKWQRAAQKEQICENRVMIHARKLREFQKEERYMGSCDLHCLALGSLFNPEKTCEASFFLSFRLGNLNGARFEFVDSFPSATPIYC